MRYWYDTEFYEQGPEGPVSWISIGVVAEDGRELYLENAEFDWSPVPHDHFIMGNVAPHLQGGLCQVTRGEAAFSIRDFITLEGTEMENQLWAYYAAYDHVVLAQLFGRMVDMPQGVPWFTMDLKQELVRRPKADISWIKNDNEHNALADAKWNKRVYDYLKEGDRDWP